MASKFSRTVCFKTLKKFNASLGGGTGFAFILPIIMLSQALSVTHFYTNCKIFLAGLGSPLEISWRAACRSQVGQHLSSYLILYDDSEVLTFKALCMLFVSMINAKCSSFSIIHCEKYKFFTIGLALTCGVWRMN